jgi:hypothetical protein
LYKGLRHRRRPFTFQNRRAEFNPYGIDLNLFCSSYSLATSTGAEDSQGAASCIDLTVSPTPGTPNELLRKFWRQAAHL